MHTITSRLQTGFDLSDNQVGTNYGGDIAISFTGQENGYEFAIDFGKVTKDYSNTFVEMNSDEDGVDSNPDSILSTTPGFYEVSQWNDNIHFTQSSPFAADTGILKGAASAYESGFEATTDPIKSGDFRSYYQWASFNLADLGLSIENHQGIGAHWTMSCGNDVVEGFAPIHEPTTMLLFGTGIAGLASIGRRKIRK